MWLFILSVGRRSGCPVEPGWKHYMGAANALAENQSGKVQLLIQGNFKVSRSFLLGFLLKSGLTMVELSACAG